MSVCARLVVRDVSVAESRIARLRLFGELDRDTVQELCDRVIAAVGCGRRSVVIDLSSVTWCDNASLFTLLGVHRALQCTGGGLRLVAGGSRCLDLDAGPFRVAGRLPVGPAERAEPAGSCRS